MKTTAITVGSTVKVIGAGPYRFMHGVVTGLDGYGLAIVALVEAEGTHLTISLAKLEAE
jgi:hypothetical protein